MPPPDPPGPPGNSGALPYWLELGSTVVIIFGLVIIVIMGARGKHTARRRRRGKDEDSSTRQTSHSSSAAGVIKFSHGGAGGAAAGKSVATRSSNRIRSGMQGAKHLAIQEDVAPDTIIVSHGHLESTPTTVTTTTSTSPTGVHHSNLPLMDFLPVGLASSAGAGVAETEDIVGPLLFDPMLVDANLDSKVRGGWVLRIAS